MVFSQPDPTGEAIIGVDLFDRGAHDGLAGCSKLLEQPPVRAQCSRPQQIVRREQQHPLAAGQASGAIEIGREADVAGVHLQPDPRIVERLDDRHRTISAGVV